MSRRVHIQIADRGWILEKCAKEIAARSADISFGTEADPRASLQYYMNYSARARPLSSVEVAFFTHSEEDQVARRRYFDAALSVDHCVCMSSRQADELIANGVATEKISIFSPGVDLDAFRPRIRIGVVGRTYDTKRKGEALVAEVMNVPGIEWRFTGSGWPGETRKIAEDEMPDFYNSLDYLLVPSLYEGGPMSVLESLACGVPIIASDVGWVRDFPHIPFRTGDVGSLRLVLKDLVREREQLRSSVLDRTWEAWADGHIALFDKLLHPGFHPNDPAMIERTSLAVSLVTHGVEKQAKGGPSIRAPRTAAALRERGVVAKVGDISDASSLDAQLVHLFNIWPSASAIEAARQIVSAGRRLILSPILLDLSEMDFWNRRVLEVAREGDVNEASIERLQGEYSDRIGWTVRRNAEPGFASRLREINDLADGIIFLSERERSLYRDIAGDPALSEIIRNPVDAQWFGSADPEIFRDWLGIDEFILNVGRIEPRKNQLFLATAAKQLGLPLVLIGDPGVEPSYTRAVEAIGGDMLRIVGRLGAGADMMRSAYAACRVFALPSWAEGAPLAALEAAAGGARLVLSNRSGEQEYFGSSASYADPAKLGSLKKALLTAWKAGRPRGAPKGENHVPEFCTWEAHAARTEQFYRAALERPMRKPAHAATESPYSLGEVINFGDGKNSAEFDAKCRLSLDCRPRPARDLFLAVRIAASHSDQVVELHCQGAHVATWTIPAGIEVLRLAHLPIQLVRQSDELALQFLAQKSTVDTNANELADRSHLEIGALQIVEAGSDDLFIGLVTARPMPLSTPIMMDDPAGVVETFGFHPPEPAGTWSAGHASEVVFQINEEGPVDLLLEFDLPLPESSVKIGTYNDVARSTISGRGHRKVRLGVKPGKIGGVCGVTFEVSPIFVPAEHGQLDDRHLGVLVKSLTLVPAQKWKWPRWR